MHIRSRQLTLVCITALVLATNASGQGRNKEGQGTQLDQPILSEGSSPDPGSLTASVPQTIRVSDVLDSTGKKRVAGMTFALYGPNRETLWLESQNVPVDERGHYSAVLGSMSNAGIPPELFRSGTAQTLGIRVDTTAEQFFALASSPYAVSADNATHLGGKPATDFISKDDLREEVRSVIAAQTKTPELESSVSSKSDKVSVAAVGNGNSDGPQPSHADLLAAIAAVKADVAGLRTDVAGVKTDVAGTQTAILAKLNEPEPFFQAQLCAEGGVEFEIALKQAVEVKGKATAEAGAKAFSNGASVEVEATPSLGQRTEIKGALALPKLGLCWDIAAIVRNIKAAQNSATSARSASIQAATSMSSLIDAVANLDESALQERVANFASELQLSPDKIFDGLEAVRNLSPGSGPFSPLDAGSHLVELANTLPLPPQIRTALQKPADLLGFFNQLRTTGVCHAALPTVLQQSLAPICALVASEPFAPLLHRVDNIVDDINGIVTNVQNRLPTSADCKFFCKGFLGF